MVMSKSIPSSPQDAVAGVESNAVLVQLQSRQSRAANEEAKWVSIEDTANEKTWRFEVAFLRSPWRCIYGDGCKGIHPSEDPTRFDGCCTYGAQLTDGEDFMIVAKAVARLTKSEWQHHALGRRKGWFKRRSDATIATRVVDGGCIFLNRPGSSMGPGCALHVGAVREGETHVNWKPNVCWQVPLRRSDAEVDGRLVSTLRAWTRTDWGTDGTADMWWCVDDAAALTAVEPVYRSLHHELRALVGDVVYAELVARLDEWPQPTTQG